MAKKPKHPPKGSIPVLGTIGEGGKILSKTPADSCSDFLGMADPRKSVKLMTWQQYLAKAQARNERVQ